MDAVAADQHVAANLLAGLQRHLDAVLVLRHGDAARAEAFGLWRNGVEQQLDQVGAMDVVHRRAVAAGRLVAERGLVEHVAGAQIAIVIGLRLDADRAHAGLEAELAQHDCRIGGDLDAGADLVHDRRLLQHQRVNALMAQRNRSS